VFVWGGWVWGLGFFLGCVGGFVLLFFGVVIVVWGGFGVVGLGLFVCLGWF